MSNTTPSVFTTVTFPVRQYTRTKASKYDALLQELATTVLSSGEGIAVPTEFTNDRSAASISSTLSKAAKRLNLDIQVAALTDGSYAIRQRVRPATAATV